MSRANFLKDEYIEAREKAKADGHSNTVYTFEMLQKLRDMAEEDVYPDSRFGDEECNVWSMFHCFHMKGE